MNTDILSHEVSLYERRRREFEEEHRVQWVVIHEDDVVSTMIFRSLPKQRFIDFGVVLI